MKLFVCCEAANADLKQRLEEAGGGGTTIYSSGREDRILPLQPDLKIKYDFMVETVVYCI